MTRETAIEQHLRGIVKSRGGLCIKLNPLGYVGIPDRLVVLPEGVLFFCELKRPKGGVVSRMQADWHRRLRDLGQRVELWSTKEQIDAYFQGA